MDRGVTRLNWGDGNSTTGNVSIAGKISGISPHVYTQSGTFSASLSVTDAKGATGTSRCDHNKSPLNLDRLPSP